MANPRPRETDLYEPVKRLLEEQGYTVKAEVGAADVVGLRGDEPPVIVELKTGFSLTLFHQAIERLKVTDAVYLAVPEWKGRTGWKAFVANRTLCRRLGLGLITVQAESGRADVHLDPGPYAPRQSKVRRERLLREFEHRVGDPNTGGSAQVKRVTSYRQDALRCLKVLNAGGPTKAAEVAKAASVTRARAIMADDHYGWFERVERGTYAITPKGARALGEYAHVLEELE
ncbi:DUF2161 domain-containing phosphodiesterase [Salaquimonas pukyongi]|uniref:DUF2161 domain-containing phosphodiesterase n=1 Tax=Salaquimonas pukyongi TaxID=2712698 RepID=UPI00096B7224|nr:DUF2161 family putative PD-(D/E)XK-type phosphodiesterase [Salaquimonas pukyongi]